MSQKDDTDSLVTSGLENDMPESLRSLFAMANENTAPTGILHWSFLNPYKIGEFDGDVSLTPCDQDTWQQLYFELFKGKHGEFDMRSLQEVQELAATFHDQNVVPIMVADFRYNTPRKRFVAEIIKSLGPAQNISLPDPEKPEETLNENRAVLATAILQAESEGFSLQPYVHYGLNIKFVIPRTGYFTNTAGDISNIEVDFDDGDGYRNVEPDEILEIAYEDESLKRIQLRFEVDGVQSHCSFQFAAGASTALTRNDTWSLAAETLYGGVRGTGTAWIFYGKNHTSLVEPIIIADGFGPGPSDMGKLLQKASANGLFDKLLGEGKDIILLGYGDRETYIQANAYVAVACIKKAIQERQGDARLIVCGASMGGLITRYALAYMEHNNIDHQTSTYMSLDTPHRGAWIPIVVQYFLLFYEGQDAGAKAQANLIGSIAGRQMLYMSVPKWDSIYPDGNPPHTQDNPLRKTFFAELESMGSFPSRTKNIAAANGAGNGVQWITPNVLAVDSPGWCASAKLRTEPVSGPSQLLGTFWLGTTANSCYGRDISPFDGAPGGSTDFFPPVAKGLSVKSKVGATCFVPSVSALSVKSTDNLFVDISKLPMSSFDFQEIKWSSTNSGHAEMTPEIVAWILDMVKKEKESVPNVDR